MTRPGGAAGTVPRPHPCFSFTTRRYVVDIIVELAVFAAVMVAASLVFALLKAVIKGLWLRFKWNVLGWPPRILDPKLAAEVATEGAEGYVAFSVDHARKNGHALDDDDVAEFRVKTEDMLKSVIDVYVSRFAMKH